MLTVRGFLKKFFAWDYALTFWTLVIIFVVPIIFQENNSQAYRIVFSVIYILAALTVLSFSKKVLYISIGLFVLESITNSFGLRVLHVFSYLLSILFFIFIVVIFVIRISQSKRVTIKVILEGINGYFLLVLMFTMLTRILLWINGNSLYYSLDSNPNYTLSDLIYYSTVTMTTLGYGEMVPVTPVAKSLSTLIAVTGQFYIAILVAMLVGKYIAQQKTED